MRIASVILDIPTQALDRLYSYVVPEHMESAEVGCAVAVPFGRRMEIGFIVGMVDGGGDGLAVGPSKLKPIASVESKPYFDAEGAACALHLSHEYVAPLASCIRLFTPPGGVPRAVPDGPGWRIEHPVVGEVDDRFVKLTDAGRQYVPRKGAVKQQAVLEALAAGELKVAELAMELGQVSGVLSALESRGVVTVERRRRMRGVESPAAGGYAAVSMDGEVTLTDGQREALSLIARARESADGSVVLVDGVTGSGKTEVYLRAIQPVIDAGGRALVLVPEIALTPQTVSRFRGRFGDRVAVMHSRMSDGERYDQWDFIRSGLARVVVGARSALFTPIRNLQVIIIDEEHEGSYKQDSAPRYHARDVALWMARQRGATLILGSATPSIESLYACARRPGWTRTALPQRANGKALPEVTVVDMAREFHGGSRSMFSAVLTGGLADTLGRGEKAILLLNQRGFAKFLLCRDCGFVPECPQCATSLTYHEFEYSLQCHHCGWTVPVPPACPQCASPYLKRFGAGTQRVEAELRELLDGLDARGAQIIRMDADTTKGKGAHRRLLERFMEPGAAVLLGTQMIAKGLDFEDVTLVGVINADTMLKVPDFRSAERTYDLIEQVAGRAGRAHLAGRVVVQTYWAESAAIAAAARHDRALFLRDELPKRRTLGYPPYTRMANILVSGKDSLSVKREAQNVYDGMLDEIPAYKREGWTVLPPTPCPLSKLRNVFRWHIVLRAPQDEDIPAAISPYFRKRKAVRGVSVAIDIDPLTLI